MSENIIEAKNINLKYKFVQSLNFRNSLFQTFKKGEKEKRSKTVHALKDLTFNIERGKTIGLIGGNGAGKSTLLRIFANVYEPDSGEISINTDSVSLLALGAGFQNDLPGIDNIYMNGILLGLSKKEVDEKIDEIVEFSELGEFIYAPLRTYSSGMRTKLAFSIASHIEPDLMLIDEVFSVGDARFKKKSDAKIRSLINENEKRTVIMVSHSLGVIEDLCDEVIWLEKGSLVEIGETKEIVKKYREFMS
ncbi:ABC transporter ATP-binding protein [Cytobacillus firmus]|uniref:ABC transporter ATP-binding protein n=1 Tax=Cytobacillus firmus TaxID=1399 RepID=UPI0021615A88|nr:ABC transporter ATP-binding protein [Cytobacillus firmus]MCS0654757.1 ABC transporter ATP-binding protein [Cytobacillus firmus]MCU1807078.1 ABC transporter ATP-binding protein [Cytobacillus firmus]